MVNHEQLTVWKLLPKELISPSDLTDATPPAMLLDISALLTNADIAVMIPELCIWKLTIRKTSISRIQPDDQ